MELIILDRDGVLKPESDGYVKSVDEWLPIPNSLEAVGKLIQAGFNFAVASNQRCFASGYFTTADLDAMHSKMERLAAQHNGHFSYIAYCPHGPDDGCDCRKPLPGLIHQIEQGLNCSAKSAWMVGDSIRDLEAGVKAGCMPALVRTGKGATSEEKLDDAGLADTPVFDDLNEFVDFVINQSH